MTRPQTGPPGPGITHVPIRREAEALISFTAPAITTTTGEARYDEWHRTADLSVGHYVIPAGADDPQSPHTEDEIYMVLRGKGHLDGPGGGVPAVPGTTIFVPAGESHRFIHIEEDLHLVVVFAPAEHTRAPAEHDLESHS